MPPTLFHASTFLGLPAKKPTKQRINDMNYTCIKKSNPGCHQLNRLKCAFAIALLVAGLNAQSAGAVAYQISWLDLSSVPRNSSVVNGTTFTLPGYNGVVTVSYTGTKSGLDSQLVAAGAKREYYQPGRKLL